MNADLVTLIHYGELSLKGRNRSLFEIELKQNIEKAAGGTVKRFRGRFVLEGGQRDALSRVFGVAWYAEAFRVMKDIESIKKEVLKCIKTRLRNNSSFGVYVKRSDKEFPYTSMQIADRIGREISEKYGMKVDLVNPDLSIFIEVADEAYFYFDRKEGLRGFPVGVSGRVLSLLSGGIDSPVSSFLMMKRGCEVDFIHFHVFTDNAKIESTKISKLLRYFTAYRRPVRIHLAPYYPFETALLSNSNSRGYELIIFRRFMARVAEKVATDTGCGALVTGDSLGQVASQTIENITLLKSAVSIPVFQPLLTYDKQEIVDLAKYIGTYDMSIESYKDCCSIISSNPRTKANACRIVELEKSINIEGVVENTLNLLSVREIY
ncbi:MAG: tRNA uracil 4-sulfurtransferase ThiI [Deltaproteobacteria bacterium]